MPQDAPPDGSAQDPVPEGPWSRVAGMQAKLHRWAVGAENLCHLGGCPAASGAGLAGAGLAGGGMIFGLWA
jgi:hypothetical protein